MFIFVYSSFIILNYGFLNLCIEFMYFLVLNLCIYSKFMYLIYGFILLPARASEQGNVIGLVSVYIVVIKKNL